MAKITPKNYIDAKDDLAKVGFMSLKEMIKKGKKISEISTAYGIPKRSVELVKTTSSFSEYQTVRRLEKERESLENQLAEKEKQASEVKPKPKTWQYVVASAILVGFAVLLGWGVMALIGVIDNFIRGL